MIEIMVVALNVLMVLWCLVLVLGIALMCFVFIGGYIRYQERMKRLDQGERS